MNFFNQLGDFFSNVGEQATYYILMARISALHQKGQSTEAIELAEQALKVAKRTWGNNHINVAITFNNLASLYHYQGKYNEAEPLYQQALLINKHLFKGVHTNIVTILNNLFLLYCNLGKYNEAKLLYQEALTIKKHLFNGEHPELAGYLDELANIYAYHGKYSEAEHLYQEALAMRKRLFNGDHPDVAQNLNTLANIYLDQGKYNEAESLHQEALAMRKRLFNGDHPDVASSLCNLALLYSYQGKYSEAEPLHQEALAMRKVIFNGDYADLAHSLFNLASLYHFQEKYSQAESIYQEVLAMTQRLPNDYNNVFNAVHLHVATALNNIACLYNHQGKYSQAESLHQEALAMRKRLFKSDHPDLVVSLNNLAHVYYDQEKHSQAEPLFQQALAMSKRLVSGDNSDVATILNNLANLYHKQGKYSKAETVHQEALAIRKRLFKSAHPELAQSLNNLAALYRNQGKYSRAELLYEDALEMYKRLFNNDHPDVAINLNSLARLYAVTNRHKQALEKLKEATEVEHRLMSQEFVGSSEQTRLLFLDKIRITQYALLSLVYQYYYPLEESEKKSQAIHTALDLVLKRKALSNAASAAFNAAMYSDRYPQLKDDFQTWRERWQQIINLQSSLYLPENFPRLEANKELLNQLYIEVETLEKNITAEVPELRLENQLVDRTAIALELPANSTLIEFAYFPLYDFITQQYQNPRYLAFILPAKQPDRVQMIDLGEADKIDDLIGKVRQACYQINLENMGPSWKTEKPKPEPQNPFFELTTAIFKPLQNYLQGQQLFICPDGALTLIPFQILPLDSQTNQLLIDQYQITYLTAGRDLLRYKYQPNRSASESLVIADPNFDLSANEAVASANPIPKEGLSINLNSLREKIRETLGTEAQKPFSPVPMTREIAEAVAAQFKVNPLLQNDALKTYLTNGKCPHKLVLATHGFFLPQNDPPQPPLIRGEFIEPGFRFRQIETTENPLLRSGLALAGANTWLLGGEIPPEAAEGIVFAQDVAGFDLWANELIILIACETAVGDVKIGEGVKGLRSAFTAAGARVLIMSLWSVPAQVSIILMNRFFVNINQGKLSGQKALQEAQNYIRTMTRKELESLPTGEQIIQEIRRVWREKYPELLAQWEAQTYPLQARYFWGAWVCVGS